MRRRVPIIALLAALSGPAPARAEYPDQPIKAVVPFAAGGYVDGFARIFTDGSARCSARR